MLTPDGRTVVCDAQPGFEVLHSTGTLEIDAYSAATGQRERVLYRHTGQGNRDGMGVLGWVGPGNTVIAMVPAAPTRADPFSLNVVVGVIAQGKLIPLLPGSLPLGQGPGAIAF